MDFEKDEITMVPVMVARVPAMPAEMKDKLKDMEAARAYIDHLNGLLDDIEQLSRGK